MIRSWINFAKLAVLFFYLILFDADDWSLGHISVSGSEEICIGGQRLRIVSAPVSSHPPVFLAATC